MTNAIARMITSTMNTDMILTAPGTVADTEQIASPVGHFTGFENNEVARAGMMIASNDMMTIITAAIIR
jgi:hypothetical protein